ncbi:MAG: hypothetical protein F7C36_00355 [Desulfurococcales archaeon]|nr:hypothetical protein [Desulfurococcales archaeon]
MKAIHITTIFFLTVLALSPLIQAKAENSPIVCTYYYAWYGGPDHPWTNILDTPVLGFYNSSYIDILVKQLKWIREAGIDCLIISWWGPGHFTDLNARKVFELLAEYGLKAVILVEPYLGQDPSNYNATWWNQTLAYIDENYIGRYPDSYLYLDGKPLVLAFNPVGETYKPDNASGYAVRIVGNGVDGSGYKDWDLWPDYDKQLTGELRIRKNGYVALAPRYDDEHFRPGGVPQYDPDLSRGWYQRQWEWVLEHQDQVRIIAIYSWNEYHERSMIEPHNDATAYLRDPFYLYKITADYIQKLEEPSSLVAGTRLGASMGFALLMVSLVVGFLARLAGSRLEYI